MGISDGSEFAIGLRSTWRDAAWADAVVGDFNGDGRDDVAARLAGAWWVSLSTEEGTAGAASRWGVWKDVAWENVTVGDFDGDGRDDIAARHKFGWWVARTTDNGFETSLWGTWNNVDWTAVAAIETANPPVAPVTTSAQTAFATSEQDAVATLWSSTDDDEFASALLAV